MKNLRSVLILTVVFLSIFSSAVYSQEPPIFIRGDANGDEQFDLSDVVFSLSYLFQGGRHPSCEDAADMNDDGLVDIADAIYGALYLFQGAAPMSSPSYYPGTDPTEDTLTCNASLSTVSSPRIFYADLESGPATGGRYGQGTIVSIYGRGFGNKRDYSVVSVGDVEVSDYLFWSDKQITVQIGSYAQTGKVHVHRYGWGSSNGFKFTVRPGNIYFVSNAGSDGNPGTYDKPWKNLVFGKKQLGPGDILYVKDDMTVKDIEDPNSGLVAAVLLDTKHTKGHGTEEMPIAMVALPGAKVQVGCPESTCPQYGFFVLVDYWIISGFTAVGNLPADAAEVDHWGSAGIHVVASDVKIVANTVPKGSYYGINIPNNNFTISSHKRNNIKIIGNHVYETRNSLIYYGGYPVIDGKVPTGLEIAWNTIHDNQKGFGIKLLAHKPEDKVRGVSIHDNLVYNVEAAGIQLGNSTDEVGQTINFIEDARVYNNIVFNSGRSSEASCVYSTGEPVMELVFQHNTLVNCGVNSDQGASFYFKEFKSLVIENNIFVQPDNKKFFINKTGATHPLNNNLFFGAADIPNYGTHNLTGNPLFLSYGPDVAPQNYDFHLSGNSPAVDSGVFSLFYNDKDGFSRPQGDGYDMGVYEYLP